jgi:hypothetical protein
MPKRRRFRRGPRIATKVLEEAIVERAKKLRDDPDILFPECRGHEDHFFKNKIKFERVARYKDSEKKIAALTRRGDQLSRAYATSLQIALKEEVPRLASIKIGGRDISYVYNRKVRKELVVGVQYYDDPDLRLLAFAKMAKLKRIHLYSMKNGFVCTGKEDKPPAKYVSEVLATTKCSLTKKGECHVCAHCEREGVPYLKIIWKAPGVDVMICESCAKEENTYITLTKRFMALEPKWSFDIEVHPNFKFECEEELMLNSMVTPQKDVLDRYMEGGITDYDLILDHMEFVRNNVPSSAGRVLALGSKCYGDDAEAFIDALNPSKTERKALEILLDDMDGNILVETATPNKVLMMFWDNYGQDIVEEIIGDEEIARKVFEKGQWNKETPAQVLKTAMSKAKKEMIESTLPKYRGLPAVAAFADRVARAYKAKGKQSALMETNRESSQDTKVKSVKYAFLLALDSAIGKEWQFNKEQLDFGTFLKDYAKKLMESEGNDYHDSLQELLRVSGSTQKIY